MIVPDYYYVIVGGGLAGLQLALRIHNDLFFKGKRIAIIDPSLKKENDKTWCYWEKNSGLWDHLITKSWKKGKFISSTTSKDMDLAPYSYKMLRSKDFYDYAKAELQESHDFIQDEISKIDPVTRTAKGNLKNYTATHFFDSRPPEGYKNDEKSTLIYQHFKGWYIETDKEEFKPEVFTMMDYRIKHEGSTSFTYVLPISPTKALVEFTFFTPHLTEDRVYEDYLQTYIKQILKIGSFRITEKEQGIIPMTDYFFQKENSVHITKIGTAGGWVKASSGYSFKNAERKTEIIIENIKSGLPPGENLTNKKFRKYDSIFLDVLQQRNDLGEFLFTKFYTRNDITDIFRFLDEETDFIEDLKIILSLYHPQFIKSFFRKV